MSYFVYLIKSGKNSKSTTYVGYTKDIDKRLKVHNKGKGAKFTRGRQWKLIYNESFKTKKEAMRREYYIKKNRNLRNLIKKRYK